MKTSIAERNTMIRFTVAEIKKQEARLDVLTWFNPADGLEAIQIGTEDNPYACLEAAKDCGTTLCFGGWLIYLYESQAEVIIRRSCGTASILDVVAELLGISLIEAKCLTMIQEWPSGLRRQYVNAITDAQHVQALEARLEHYILTGV